MNYTIDPWIGSGIFRLADFCNLKKESVAADSHTFSLSLSSRACWSPCFQWAEHLCWSFFVPTVSGWNVITWHEWKFVQTPAAGVLFGKGGSSPSKTWFVVCVSSHRFWQPRGFVSAWSSFGFVLQRIPNSSCAFKPSCVPEYIVKQVVSAGGDNHLFSAARVV